VVFDDTVDMAAQARFAMEFCVVESCGKCTPCRIGSVRGVEVIDHIVANENRDDNLILLHELCDTMEFGSLCAMGGMTPYPVRSALAHFPQDFFLQDAEGSLSQDAEGSLLQDAEGSLLQDAEGSTSLKAASQGEN